VSAFLLALSATVSGYTTMVLMGGGKVKVASMVVADYFRGVLDYPAGAAVAIVLLAVTLVLAILGHATAMRVSA
jgi:ABC-type spermidine/putrescine transport system permease subunit I